MIHIEQAVVVEGKYDKIKLSSIIDGVIITTNGFSVLKNKEKLDLIRYYAKNKGIIILTDSDSAGFKIRGYLKGAVNEGNIINVYIPDVFGKEKRKNAPSKEGKLGVEGIDCDVILEAFKKAGVIMSEKNDTLIAEKITVTDLYELGLSGGSNSSEKRKLILKELKMPELLSASAMLEVVNTMMSKEEFCELCSRLL